MYRKSVLPLVAIVAVFLPSAGSSGCFQNTSLWARNHSRPSAGGRRAQHLHRLARQSLCGRSLRLLYNGQLRMAVN